MIPSTGRKRVTCDLGKFGDAAEEVWTCSSQPYSGVLISQGAKGGISYT